MALDKEWPQLKDVIRCSLVGIENSLNVFQNWYNIQPKVFR